MKQITIEENTVRNDDSETCTNEWTIRVINIAQEDAKRILCEIGYRDWDYNKSISERCHFRL